MHENTNNIIRKSYELVTNSAKCKIVTIECVAQYYGAQVWHVRHHSCQLFLRLFFISLYSFNTDAKLILSKQLQYAIVFSLVNKSALLKIC